MFNLGPTRASFIRFVMVVGLQLHGCAVLSCVGGFLKNSKHKCLKKGWVVKFPISFPKFSEKLAFVSCHVRQGKLWLELSAFKLCASKLDNSGAARDCS